MRSSGKNNKIIGTLVPISALSSLNLSKKDQGTFAIGFAFLDWLYKTHQSAWQLLPLHQTQFEKGLSTKHVPSPYKGYGIGLDPKYLSAGARAQERKSEKEIEKFIDDNSDWVEDYALFCALTDKFGTDEWSRWDSDLRDRKKEALDKFKLKFEQEIDQHITTQWQLYKEYEALKNKAAKLKIKLIGDLPYYLSVNSPLVWAHQDLFQLEKDGKMKFVSGLPDGPSAHFGRQVWGHPLYEWKGKNQTKKVVLFWEMRLKYLAKLFDFIRFDHAKGLFIYGVIDPNNDSNDKLEKGPGSVVFEQLIKFSARCGLKIYAEDSGDKVQVLRDCLKKLKIPGIKIFRFSMDEKKGELHMQYADMLHYPKLTVAQTTTHDTETLMGYLQLLTREQKQIISTAAKIKYNPNDKIFAARIRDALIMSSADIVIIPIQDWLLTTDRINIPGTEKEIGDTNWQYKLKTPVEKLPVF